MIQYIYCVRTSTGDTMAAFGVDATSSGVLIITLLHGCLRESFPTGAYSQTLYLCALVLLRIKTAWSRS